MSGFFGTERQIALQKQTHAMRDWIAETPGIYNAGRFMGADDPDRVPWNLLTTILHRDGILGLRMISQSQARRCFPKLEGMGCRIDSWDVFIGTAQDAGRRAREMAAEGVTAGIAEQPPLVGAETEDTRLVQRFLADNGLAPFPGTLLAGRPPRSATVVLGDDTGGIAATGHAYFPHNRHSPFRDFAWIGLIAVAEDQRGRGLGRFMNALLVKAAFEKLGARSVYELVATENLASRRVVEACGLRLAPELRCGVAVSFDAGRFTR